jgi:hypothetical protein
VESFQHSLFRYARWVPSSPIAHVSASPPLIPDGRLSRVRLAAAACPQRPFPDIPKLKRSPVYTPWMPGYTSGSTPSEVITAPWHCVQTMFPLRCPPLTESPFAACGCYPLAGGVQHLLGEHYPSFLAPTGSCAPPQSSHGLRLPPYIRESLQVAASPCWKMVVPDVISASLSLDA